MCIYIYTFKLPPTESVQFPSLVCNMNLPQLDSVQFPFTCLYPQSLTNWQCSVSRYAFVPSASHQLTVFGFPSTACTINLPPFDSVQFPFTCLYPQSLTNWQCSVSCYVFVPSASHQLTVFGLPSTACTINLPPFDRVQFPVNCLYHKPTTNWQYIYIYNNTYIYLYSMFLRTSSCRHTSGWRPLL
jgi:hypothetical protein